MAVAVMGRCDAAPTLRPRARGRYNPSTMATCPECDADVDVDEVDADIGDEVSCPECGQNLVVSGTDPLELDFSTDEDDEDEDDDEDELDEDDSDDEEEEEEEEDEDDGEGGGWKE